MCWNYQISLFFVVIYICVNSCFWLLKPKFWKEYLIFGTFYLAMELFQTIQWLFGKVYPNVLTGIKNCDKINVGFTVVAYVLIWLQPVLYSYIGYRTVQTNGFIKNYFYFTIFLFFYSMAILIAGFYFPHSYSVTNSIFGLSTCTNEGGSGHLVWRFKPSSIDYAPNNLMYLVLCGISFMMYDRIQIKIISYGWMLSLVMTGIILRPHLLELSSSWCLMSIFGNLLIVVYVLVSMKKRKASFD